MKIEEPDLLLAETTKLGVVFATRPVGAEGDPAVAPGIVTTSGVAGEGARGQSPRERVAVPMPVLAIPTGLASRKVMPQGFTRCASVRSATPGISETRL